MRGRDANVRISDIACQGGMQW